MPKTPPNPIDTFVQLKQQDNTARRQKDFDLWHAWKNAPEEERPEKLEPLLNAFQPLVNQKTKEWKPPMIPKSSFQGELQKHLIAAFETYNPDKAALTTHVHNRIQKVKRYVAQNQNMAYIPEAKIRLIGPIDRAINELNEDLGREPTHSEIADHLGLSVRTVTNVQKARRKDIPGSAFMDDPSPNLSSRFNEVKDLIHENLSPQQQLVHEHMYGLNGKKQIEKTNDLAKQLNMSASQVSRLKSGIIAQYKEYL